MNRQLMRQLTGRACPVSLSLTLVLILTVLTIISGCAGGTDIGNPEASSFSSDSALKSYIAGQYAQSALPDSLQADIMDGVSQPTIPGDPRYGAFENYSETSILKNGTDESDKTKTDGTYIYVAGASSVHIVDTKAEGGMREAARISVKGPVDSLFLYGPTLIILYTPEDGAGNFWAGRDAAMAPTGIGMAEWLPVNSRIGILTVDIQDPENPAIQKDLQAEGCLVSARLTNGRLHVITQFLPDLPPLELWHDGSEAGEAQTIENNQQLLDAMTLDDLIPSYAIYDADGVILRQGRLVKTKHFIKPENPGGGSVVAVITIDLTDLSKTFTSVGFIGDVNQVYASGDMLVLAATRYDATKAENGGTDNSPFQTVIHQLGISETDVRYVASGTVPGQILDPFSISEYAGTLRIATTTGYVQDGSAQNHIYCLKRIDKMLVVVGRLENLASGERGSAARFIQKKGFFTASAETGLVLTLDLSNPENPSLAGELKAPGIVAAIYPLGGPFLLTIGKAVTTADNETWYQGVQVTLFDVSDLAVPKLLSTQTIGDRGTESEALYSHKALTFRPEESLLALPIDLYEHQNPQQTPSETGTPIFNGLYIYEITEENTFQYRGRIPMSEDSTGIIGDTDWLRGIFINNQAYAVSADKVAAAVLPDLSEPFDSVTLGE